MIQEMIDFLKEQDYSLIENREKFLEEYPPLIKGEYIPQPNIVPERYPAMIRTEYLENNDYGADNLILSIIYLK